MWLGLSNAFACCDRCDLCTLYCHMSLVGPLKEPSDGALTRCSSNQQQQQYHSITSAAQVPGGGCGQVLC